MTDPNRPPSSRDPQPPPSEQDPAKEVAKGAAIGCLAGMGAVGGAIGIVLGVGLAASVALISQGAFTAEVTWQAIALAFGFSMLVGVVFGVYPAAQASRLNPIEALRYE